MTLVADEIFPGQSQPEPEKEHDSQPSTPQKNSPATSPQNHQNKTPCKKKMTPRRKKPTPKKQKIQPSPPPPCPPPPPPPSPAPPHAYPGPNATATQPSPTKPKKGGRTRPNGFRVGKKTAAKQGMNVGEGQCSSRRRPGRIRARKQAMDVSSSESNDDSEDDDYIHSCSETDEDEIDIGDFIVDEEEIDYLYDDIPEKQFQDFFDGSSNMDKAYNNGKIWTHQEFGSIKLEPWLIFPDREAFTEVFKDYCIQEGFGVFVEKSDSKRYVARCAIDTCDWRIYASTMVDKVSWAIKKLTGEHKTCGRLEVSPVVTSEWLCKHLEEDIKANPDVPVESLQKLCMERYRIMVKKKLFYKVKVMAKEKIYGGFGKAYSLLPRYAEMVKETNPGSYALISWTQTTRNVAPKFKACFFSFAAQVRGFLRGCRPLIGIDGTHLSGYFRGILLTAVGIDGNNEIFVIAYGIVDTESMDSWSYFLRNLKLLFEKEGCYRDDWTFISDRMRGVDSAVNDTFPRATRRVCCQHLYMNCKNAGFSGTTFHKLFWIAADAYNDYVFNKAMEKINDYDPKAVEYLNNCTEHWSRHTFDPTICFDHNTTNFVESFNACTKPYRDLPVLTLLEAIRQWCMKRIGSRFDKAAAMGPEQLTDYATKVLQTRSDKSRFCYATPCGGGEFEVRDGHVHFPIKLQNGSCACGKWQISGIPCKHGLRVIYHQRLQPADFVSSYFKGVAYKQAYAEHMHPMPDHSQWPSFNLPQIQPPVIKRSAGRPRKQRKRGPNEAKKGKRTSTVKCSKCKEMGHNILTCGTKKMKGGGEASTSGTPSAAKKRSKTQA